jgi:hypothetical protein
MEVTLGNMHKVITFQSGIKHMDGSDLDFVNTYDGDDLNSPNASRPTRAFAGGDNAGASFYFEITADPEQRLHTPEVTEPTQVDSHVFEITFSEDRFVNDYQIEHEVIVNNHPLSISYASSNEAIATVNNSGFVTYVSNGVAHISAIAGNLTQSLPLTLLLDGDPTVVSFDYYESGSVGANSENNIDSRLVGKTKATHAPVYTSQDHVSGIYVRNPSCWLGNIDITCVSPWNSTEAHLRAGTLITPRHVLFAAHYPIAQGATIRFVALNNTVVTRTVTHIITHPDFSNNLPDFQIGLLDSDVPGTITPAKVLPDNYTDYFSPSYRYAPVVIVDQEEKALVADIGGTINGNYVYLATPTDSQRLAFSEIMIVGDSGSPVLLIINDTPVIITIMTFGGAGQGSSIPMFKDDLNQMISDVDASASISTGYTLSEINLTGFNNYA